MPTSNYSENQDRAQYASTNSGQISSKIWYENYSPADQKELKATLVTHFIAGYLMGSASIVVLLVLIALMRVIF
jgi:hypothetical protein